MNVKCFSLTFRGFTSVLIVALAALICLILNEATLQLLELIDGLLRNALLLLS